MKQEVASLKVERAKEEGLRQVRRLHHHAKRPSAYWVELIKSFEAAGEPYY